MDVDVLRAFVLATLVAQGTLRRPGEPGRQRRSEIGGRLRALVERHRAIDAR